MGDIHFFNYRFLGYATEKAKFFTNFFGNRLFRPTNQYVWLDANFSKLGHTLLSWFGLEFTSCTQAGQQSHVYKEDICFTYLAGELSHRFSKGQALNITNGSTYFGNEHIYAFPGSINSIFNFVGHMGNNLHGFTKVIPPSFLANH